MLLLLANRPVPPGPRSEIHGRGLFCKRNIEAGEMVIEYAGNVIRAVLTDKREKYYDSKVSQGLLGNILTCPLPALIRFILYHNDR